MRKRKSLLAWALSAAVLITGLSVPAAVWGAEGDPALRFDLTTADATESLSAGDQIKVEVGISREDGSAEPYSLYSIMLDIHYDNTLFDVKQLKTSGLKRPDGQNWIGSWTCGLVPAGASDQRVRVLYVNIGGMLTTPMQLDPVNGPLTAASFVLTAKKDVKDVSTEVSFAFTESGGSDLKKGPSVIGKELTLHFGAAGGSSSGDGSAGGGSGGSGSGSSGSGSAGSNGSNGGSSGSSGSGSSSGSGGASSGSQSGTSAGGNDGGSQTGGSRVRFSDLTDMDESHWAAAYVKKLVDGGILSGNENREFQPDKPVTRAEFAQMLSAAFGYQSGGEAGVFADVRADDWYVKPVMALYRAGIVSGIGDGLFGAEETLSRQDMALMLSRVLKDQNIILTTTREYASFSDQVQVEDYARQALWELYCSGIISGTTETTLSPLEDSTRAQVAAVLSKLIEQTEGGR